MSELNESNRENESCIAARNAPQSPGVIATQTAFYVLIFLVSLIGNALVIRIATRTRRIKVSTTNLLIANMAASDLLISIFAIPRKIAEILTGNEKWLFAGLAGQLSCKCIYFLQDISTAVSIQSLVVISLDRFVAVVFPYRRPLMSVKICKFIVIPVIWFIAMALHSPYFYTFRIKKVLNEIYCYSSWAPALPWKETQEAYYMVLLIFLILLPLVILSTLYSMIISQLRVKNTPTDARERLREDSKVIKKIIAIIVVYILCLAPINVFAVLFYFVWDWHFACGARAFEFVSLFILFSNSAMNPLVYFAFNERYRQELRNMTKSILSFRSEDSCETRCPPSALTGADVICTESVV